MKDEEKKSGKADSGAEKVRQVTKFSEEYFIPPSKKDHYLLMANDGSSKVIID